MFRKMKLSILHNQNFKTLKKLVGYIMQKYKFRFILAMTLLTISATTTTIGTLFFKDLIDEFITPLIGQTDVDYTFLVNYAVKVGTIYLIGALSNFGSARIMVVITQGTLKDLRDDMFENMQYLPIKFYDKNQTGDLMSHYTSDTDSLRMMISQSLPQCISGIVNMIAIFIAMVISSYWLSLIILIVLSLLILIFKNAGGLSHKYFVKQQATFGHLNGYVEEMIKGQKVIKVFSHEDEIVKGFTEINEELYDNAAQANKYSNIMMPLLGSTGNFSYLLAALVGGTFSILGIVPLSPGSVVAFVQLTRSFSMPLMQMSQQINAIANALAGAERMFGFLKQKHEKNDGKITLVNVSCDEKGVLKECEKRSGMWAWKIPLENGTFTLTKLAGDVRFNDVTFSYDGKKIILHDINLFAKPGQKISFVGSTGAGKTTITNLINNFYSVQEGTITYDGIPIENINKFDLRRSLGVVLQDTHLFSGTVKENIRYGNPNATDEEVISAAKLANAHNFIQHLSDGYDTQIDGSGESLSQGQRQLLSIARAAIANPPVLILDEATSSIDTRTEKLVQEGMDHLMEGRTVFVIAHRLSTIRNSNAIIVLENGKIIERGNHKELMDLGGQYYNLNTGAIELS